MTFHLHSRKKKKKNNQGACGGIGNQHYLPDDLLIEFILSRLPLPCLFRCTAVCKTWRRLVYQTHTLYGGTTMTKHALAVPCHPLINTCFIPTIRIFVPSDEAPVDIIRQYSPKWSLSDITNGFLLCSSSAAIKGRTRACTVCLRVCNPLTYKSVPLPIISLLLNSPVLFFSMLIFNPAVSHHYKVISFYGRVLGDEDEGRQVYEKVCVFSSQQAHLRWRQLGSDVPALLNHQASGSIEKSTNTVWLNGYAYRLGSKTLEDFFCCFHNVILSIDAKELRFEFIDSPPALDVPAVSTVWSGLDKAQDCLQYIYNDKRNIRISRLGANGVSNWALMHTICLSDDLSYYPEGDRRYYPDGACLLSVHGDDQLLLFVNTNGFLCQYDIKRRRLGYYLGGDGERVRGDANSLLSFIYCAIDPEFRRIVLRPPK